MAKKKEIEIHDDESFGNVLDDLFDNKNLTLNLEKLFDTNDSDKETNTENKDTTDCAACQYNTVNSQCFKRNPKHEYRRAFSESKLLDILDKDLIEGTSYHCISGGNIDSLSFLKHIIRQQNLDYVLLSTWCMANDDVLQFRRWIEDGTIKRLDAYCGEIFPNSYKEQYTELKKVVDLCGGRVAIFRNHAKIFAGIGNKYAFAIESSANINTNPRTENTTISIDKGLYEFYKKFYDDIKSYTRDYGEWKPWENSGEGAVNG